MAPETRRRASEGRRAAATSVRLVVRRPRVALLFPRSEREIPPRLVRRSRDLGRIDPRAPRALWRRSRRRAACSEACSARAPSRSRATNARSPRPAPRFASTSTCVFAPPLPIAVPSLSRIASIARGSSRSTDPPSFPSLVVSRNPHTSPPRRRARRSRRASRPSPSSACTSSRRWGTSVETTRCASSRSTWTASTRCPAAPPAGARPKNPSRSDDAML